MGLGRPRRATRPVSGRRLPPRGWSYVVAPLPVLSSVSVTTEALSQESEAGPKNPTPVVGERGVGNGLEKTGA